MRVLHVGKFYPPFAGGMEYFLFDLIGALREGGIAAAAVVHHERFGWTGIHPDPSESSPVYRAPTFGRLLYIPVSPAFPLWLDRAIREFQPDLLHLHLPNSSAFAAMALPRARRLPRVIHWHSDLVSSTLDRRLALAYRLYRPFEQRLIRGAEKIIATSPTYLDASDALVPWRSRCVVIPLGLDWNRLQDPEPLLRERANLRWGRSGLRVLVVGRLTYYKGHDVLIRSMTGLPEARLLIVGAGEEQGRLGALVRSLDLDRRVSLVGFQSAAHLNALLATCDLLCLPSVERTEAFGLVLLEAMRFAKPVVVSDIPGSGAGWVVRSAGNGILTPPGDPVALADALRALAPDPERRRILGRSGSAALGREFGIQSVAAAVRDVYRSVLARRET